MNPPAATGSGGAGADAAPPRVLVAPNPSPYTLDGTRTHLVGRHRVAIIDPGPALSDHVEAVVAAVGDATAAIILLTHDHPDHAGATDALAERLDAPVHGMRDGTLADGDRFATDEGELVAVATPGHTPDHVAFHRPDAASVFCGDLMMGGLDTTLVAPPEGDLGEYLASLERVRALRPRIIHPAHGPTITDPDRALDAYVRHREERERQALEALGELGRATPGELTDAVYGDDLEPGLRAAARAAVVAYLEHLEAGGRVRRVDDSAWTRT